MSHLYHICHMHHLTLGGDGSIWDFDWRSSEGSHLVEKNVAYFNVVKKLTWMLRHQKKMHKRLDMIFVVNNFIWGHPLATVTNCSISGSTSCFLAWSCLVFTLFCYIMLCIYICLTIETKSILQCGLENSCYMAHKERRSNNHPTCCRFLISFCSIWEVLQQPEEQQEL